MIKQHAKLVLAIIVTVSIFVSITLANPQSARACDVGCGGIVGVFKFQ